MKRTKNIVAQHLSGVDTKLWIAPEKRKEIAVEAAADILRVHNADWKDESEEWLAFHYNKEADDAARVIRQEEHLLTNTKSTT